MPLHSHQWASVPFELHVVIGAIDKSFHLLHVCYPVNFSVCMYNMSQAGNELCSANGWNKQFKFIK